MKLKHTLLPHQKDAVAKLKGLKVGALFMEQGTGKTITAMELCRLRAERGKIDKILWLCPCSAKDNIKRELVKHADAELLSYFTICGIESLSSSIRINSYLRQLVQTYRVFLVVDESLLVKNPEAYRSKNIIALAKSCTYKLILNGTPISRNEADLYSQFYILDWRILGYSSFWQFEANHVEYDEQDPKRIVHCLNTEYLSRKIKPYTVQISKSDCLDLPSRSYATSWFNLSLAQGMHYDMVADRISSHAMELDSTTVYRLITAMQLIVSGHEIVFEYKDGIKYHSKPFFTDPYKNPRVQQLLRVIENDERVEPGAKSIIFCNYSYEIRTIHEILNNQYGEGTAVMFYGEQNLKTRNASLKRFRNDARFLVANRSCAGYSLNLQFCHRIIYFSNNYDLATRLQSEDRIHRIGQTHDMRITDICAENTIDEAIQNCLYRKENLLQVVKNNIRSDTKKDLADLLFVHTGKRKIHTVHDCTDLEDNDAKSI